eukprot:TRINITY_DN6859_c0_g1_i1.p1 TRINITY_DN6859_c0_g1~~TRINITY_DN6859_c0_g1_i1.p1  ORF type:complete len:237 (+),score=53.28 TRINITY_DN6859_c0_g1_i1:641-1351(+)
MTSELNGFMGWSHKRPPKDKLITVMDCFDMPAGFLLSHFMNLYLKGNHSVVFICVENDIGHYATVARKQGINFELLREKNKFFYLTHGDDPDNLGQSEFNYDGGEESLRNLYGAVSQIVQGIKGPVCVVMDSLNFFLNMTQDPIHLLDFIQYVKLLVSERQKSTFVGLFHSDSDDDIVFKKALKYQSDLIADVSGFESVYVNVNGELSFHRDTEEKLPVLHFELSDRNVKYTLVNK